jgi:hypothetical protein
LSPSPFIILTFTDAWIFPSSSPATIITSLSQNSPNQVCLPSLIILTFTDAWIFPSSSPTTVIAALIVQALLLINLHVLDFHSWRRLFDNAARSITREAVYAEGLAVTTRPSPLDW